jgi:antitoxin ParD1/3/4
MVGRKQVVSCQFLPNLVGLAMSTMNISLPETLKAFVDEQVAGRGYSTSSEYLRDLIRREKDRQHLRDLLQEGEASPLSGESDEDYFKNLRAEIRAGKVA